MNLMQSNCVLHLLEIIHVNMYLQFDMIIFYVNYIQIPRWSEYNI